MSEQLLQPDQISQLEEVAETANSDVLRRRARILLLYNTGQNTQEISASVGLSPRSVQFWRREFLKRGMDILSAAFEPQSPGKSSGRPEAESPSIELQPTTSKIKKAVEESAAGTMQLPKVRKNPGIKADDPMAEAGRKILRLHFAYMLSHEEGTRHGKDIEELHDMRVATRRLRAAFEVFGPYFRPKVVKNHLKRLRATGRTLGRVRDLDVFMEKAQQYLGTLPEEERPGLQPLLEAWHQEQAVERDKMLRHFDSENYQQFKEDFNDFVSTPGAGALDAEETDRKPNHVNHVVPVLIYTHVAAVRAYSNIVTNATLEQLHALRIELKKLRYAMEYFREVLGEHASEVINEIKGLQDHLGELNDANVACQILSEFIETWEERQVDLPLHERQNPQPVVAYLAAKHAERHKLMSTFPEAWAHFDRPDSLRNIALSISVL